MMTYTRSAATDRRTTGQSLRKWLLAGLISTLLGLVTGIGYFTVGGIFAPISDATGVAAGVSLIPVVLGLHTLFTPFAPGLSRLARLVGIVGLSLIVVASLVLVLFAMASWLPGGLALGAQFLGFFIQGVWLVLLGMLTFRTGLFEQRVAWAAVTGGAGYMLFTLGTPLGPDGPVSMLGGLIGLVGFVAWILWLRSALHAEVQGG